MRKKIFWLVLVLITMVGGYLRVKDLTTNPPHLGNDEISIAFDTYSLIKTGKDEHGHAWPLSFESHRTYKAPLYAYLSMPFNYWWGNTELGIRLLSAVSGTVFVLLTGLVAMEMGGFSIALTAAALAAVNPKSIWASHIGFEANLAATVMLFGLWAMVKFKKSKKSRWLVLAGTGLGLSIWGYHTQWGLAPMIAAVWPWLARKEVALKKWLLMWLVMGLIAAPIGLDFVKTQTKDNNNRANSQIWLKEPGTEKYLKESQDWWPKKAMVLVSGPVFNYLEHFNLSNNFSSGMGLFNGREPLDSGWFLWATLPLVILGLAKKGEYLKADWKWLLAWWLMCPIVPATTYGGVASVRNLAFIGPTLIYAAVGLATLKFNKKVFFISLITVNFFLFYTAFYRHYPKYMGDNFQYGYKQAWEFIRPLAGSYDRIVVEPKFGLVGQFVGVPHLYFGYFGAFEAQEMQSRVDKIGTKIGKYEFRDVDWNREEYRPKSLYVVSVINPTVNDYKANLTELGRIKNLNGNDQFLIYADSQTAAGR